MVSSAEQTLTSVQINGSVSGRYAEILSPEALTFLVELHRKFNSRRLELLQLRQVRQLRIDGGEMPDFLPETKHVRESDWIVAPLPADLQDRRVEITGPVERKMVINALNSGANMFMADFEDSNAPSWQNCIEGQINLFDANAGTIDYTNSGNGKRYSLKEETATLLVRPRGWHLEEKHISIDGVNASGSLTDFGLYFFHNVKQLMKKGSGPYFYLPKLESHLEARLWNDVFVFAQEYLDVPVRTIKATVLIETILAAFEMDEILYELQEHSAGLNCGRWDYIFSFIKKFRRHPKFVLPNRAAVGMTVHFMRSYSLLCIKTCHKRNVHAMGGMAAQIPIKNDEVANQAALEKVRVDKEREAKDGHDGTWVAHPGLVAIAKEQFDRYMPSPNQIGNKREDVQISAEDLLAIPEGTITEDGLKVNIDVAIQYLASWLGGNGCVPIYNLMEDAATAEISRAQVWQWIHHNGVKLEDGREVTEEFYKSLVPGQLKKIEEMVGTENYQNGHYKEAVELFNNLALQPDFEEFLTLGAYNQLK